MLFLLPNQQRQSTEGITVRTNKQPLSQASEQLSQVTDNNTARALPAIKAKVNR